jgi:hypothetical protein
MWKRTVETSGDLLPAGVQGEGQDGPVVIGL